LGRFLVTRIDSDKYMWVVQTWRNIELTAPYFHNGSVPDLRTAVLVMAKTELNADLTDDQVSDIVAFMKTLTGQFPEQSLPRLPETSGTTLLMEYGAMPAR
jgi:cytochrome c peroxidase